MKKLFCIMVMVSITFSNGYIIYAQEENDEPNVVDETTDEAYDNSLEENDNEIGVQIDNEISDEQIVEEKLNDETDVDETIIEESKEVSTPTISYRTHVQNDGWQSFVSNGEMSGTSGRSLRLEGIEIKLDSEIDGGIQYRTHVQNIGWQDFVSDGAMSGTSGQSLRLEAIQIQLTGEIAEQYDVYYQVHAQEFGWLGWAKNGEYAGTSGYSYRLEAICIQLIKKGDEAPTSSTYSFIGSNGETNNSLIQYRTHVQNVGWQSYKYDGAMSGTSGQSLRLEGIEIQKSNQLNVDGGIQYRTHVQNIGWQDFVSDGAMSGTSGQSLRLEAIQIKLTGELEKQYDIYYQVHAQNFGWLGWAKNGQSAGTAGYSYRLEGICIQLVKKGEDGPTSSTLAFKDSSGKADNSLLQYRTYIQNIGWQDYKYDGTTSGTTGQALRIEGIQIKKADNLNTSGSIQYRAHVQDIGWQDFVSDGAMSGTSGKSLRIEALQIKLTGDLEKQYDIYYRVHAQELGWLGWAKNGENAGTEGCSYRLESIEIKLVKKGETGPGSTSGAFKTARDLVRTSNSLYYVDGVLVVNKKHSLPSDYAPGENPTAGNAIRSLINTMRMNGYNISTSYSGYRSYTYQNGLYWSYVSSYGEARADTFSARAGYSEHQTGLAFDLIDGYGNLVESSREVNWIAKNAHKYGFIVRYQKGKEHITGYQAEPWHLRYLGVDLATKVYNSGLTLEEYLGVTGGNY